MILIRRGQVSDNRLPHLLSRLPHLRSRLPYLLIQWSATGNRVIEKNKRKETSSRIHMGLRPPPLPPFIFCCPQCARTFGRVGVLDHLLVVPFGLTYPLFVDDFIDSATHPKAFKQGLLEENTARLRSTKATTDPEVMHWIISNFTVAPQ